jgi:hypothetical protein
MGLRLVVRWWLEDGYDEDILAYAFTCPADIESYVAEKGGVLLAKEARPALWAAVARAQRAAPRRAEKRSRITPLDLALFERGSAAGSGGGNPPVVLVPRLEPRRVKEWPGAPRRLIAAVPPPKAREERERRIRDKYVQRIARVLTLAAFPIASPDVLGEDEYLLARCGQGKRASTLKNRANMLERIVRWLQYPGLGGWFSGERALLQLVRDEFEGGAPISRLHSALAAIRFAEKGGGLPPVSQVGTSGLALSLVRELGLEASASAPRERRRAPHDLLLVMAGIEDMVVSLSFPVYVRMYAWWLALKCWASLRFDDHRGMVPASMLLIPGAFRLGWSAARRPGRARGWRPSRCTSTVRRTSPSPCG